MDVGYRWYVGDLKTGKIHRQVDLPDATWSTSFDYGVPGILEGSFPLRDVNTSANEASWPTARADTAASKSFLAVSYIDKLGTETFLEGGPIWTPPKYDADTGEMQFGAAGMSTYLDRRHPWHITPVPGGSNANLATYARGVRGSSLKNAAIYLISETGTIVQVDSEGNQELSVPFADLDPADVAGYPGDQVVDTVISPDHQYLVIVRGYELPWTGTLVKQITERDGGPEIQLVPRRNPTDPRFLQWMIKFGNPILAQTGPPWQFDYTVAESDVRDIAISPGASNTIASRMWAAGEGEAEGRPIVYAYDTTLLELGWPLLEGEVTATDTESSKPILTGYATEDLAKASKPGEQWTVTVSRDGLVNVGQLRPGDWARLRVRGHHYIPDGDYDMRILAIKGAAGSEDVELTMAERLGDF